jgi:hypothetical protein
MIVYNMQLLAGIQIVNSFKKANNTIRKEARKFCTSFVNVLPEENEMLLSGEFYAHGFIFRMNLNVVRL